MIGGCRVLWLLLAVPLVLNACAGEDRAPPQEPIDSGLDSGWKLARYALQNAQHEQAVVLYARVLARAYARDDAAAIGDIGYEYALALQRNGNPKEAVKQAQMTRQELQRRNVAPFAELFLVEAVAHYAVNEKAKARAMAEQAIRRARLEDLETRGRANFILGMVAADASDAPSVERALTAMGAPTNSALKADIAELKGRRRMLLGGAKGAVVDFERAAELRRGLREYAGMARALAAAGAAAKDAGEPAIAADLYYRAGRSAAVQTDSENAKNWLTKALSLAKRNGLKALEADTRDRLRSLDK